MRLATTLFREAGLSRPKQRAVLAVSEAVRDGLDLAGLCDLDAEAAIGEMTAVPGIGPWTAEVYLLSAAGHPDIFPARDVALQSAVGHALGIDPRPGEKALIKIAESWSPWRGVASRLFWAYYREIKGREGAPPSKTLAKTTRFVKFFRPVWHAGRFTFLSPPAYNIRAHRIEVQGGYRK